MPTDISTLTSGGIAAPAQTPRAVAVPVAANVAAAAAITAATPAASAAGTAGAPAVTVGSALGAFADPPSAAEMAALRTFVNALKTDNAATLVELAKVVTDLATRRTEINALRTQMIAEQVDAAAIRTTLNAEIAALKAAVLQASS